MVIVKAFITYSILHVNMAKKYICKSCKRKRENQDDYSMEILEEDQQGHFGGISCEESATWHGNSYHDEKAEYEIKTDHPDSPPGY